MSMMRSEPKVGRWSWRAFLLALVLGCASPSLLADGGNPSGGGGGNPPGGGGGGSAMGDDDRPVGSLPILQGGAEGRGRRKVAGEVGTGGAAFPTGGVVTRTVAAFPTADGDLVVLDASGTVLLGPVWVPEGILLLDLPDVPVLVLQAEDDGSVRALRPLRG